MIEDRLVKIVPALEALLFVYGEPLPLKRAAKMLQISMDEVQTAAEKLDEHLKSSDSGLKILMDGENLQLVTLPEFSSILESFIKDEFKEELTPASLETLSLVSYLGPISRSQIEYLRGVNSSFTLRNLQIRGLIERLLHREKSNVYLYKTSLDFLKYLGLSRIEELPQYEKFHKLCAFQPPF